MAIILSTCMIRYIESSTSTSPSLLPEFAQNSRFFRSRNYQIGVMLHGERTLSLVDSCASFFTYPAAAHTLSHLSLPASASMSVLVPVTQFSCFLTARVLSSLLIIPFPVAQYQKNAAGTMTTSLPDVSCPPKSIIQCGQGHSQP